MKLLLHWMRRHDGVAHSSTLRAAGFSDHPVKSAVARGMLRRIRRSWLVTTDCSPARVAAASVGGRITCRTAAEELGLWTPRSADERAHVLLPRSASRISHEDVHIHRAVGPVPAAPRATTDPLLNVLFHVARCLQLVDALAVWESALRKGLARAEHLKRVAWRSSAARRLAEIADVLSDSGLETHFVDLMRRIGVLVQQQVWIDGHPVDALIGDRLIVQLDGFAFHQAGDRRGDLAADARLALLGYTVLRFDFYQVLFQPDLVARTIQDALAQGLHRIR